jgi:uncharacterized protein HI_1472
VIVTNYIPQEYIDKMSELKIPVVAVSFQRSDAADKGKLNPTFKDDEAAYTEGFYDGIELLGKVANREKEAAELISFVKTSQEQLKAKISDSIVDKRPKIYMANPGQPDYSPSS